MLKIISNKSDIEKEVNKIVNRISYLNNKKNVGVVAKIIEEVKKYGDAALRKYTKKFDKVELKDFKVRASEIKKAYKKVDNEFIRVITKTKENIERFYNNQKRYVSAKSKKVFEKIISIEKIGIYIPGGKAYYPSTVLHTCIVAKIAGVKNVIVTTPPMPSEGSINPYTLVTLNEIGIKNIYKIGGAQAIAALAFGTESIPKVDKIIGPGNIYVNLAKKLLVGFVGIDGLYAATELVILADSSANAKFIAYDLLAQAEHSDDALCIVITTSDKLAKRLLDELKIVTTTTKRKEICSKALRRFGKIFIVNNLNYATSLINQIAPEHLQIVIRDTKRILDRITNVGSISIGDYSSAVITDYFAGPSHLLPTTTSARFLSYLNLESFYKRISVVNYDKKTLNKVKDYIIKLAEYETLYAHAEAIKIRTNQTTFVR